MSEQTIFRSASRQRPYTQLSNAMLRDKKLRIEARGVLSLILTNKPEWKLTPEWVYEHAGVGRDRLRSIVAELIELGYCERIQGRSQGGTMGANEYRFTDEPGVFGEASPETPPESDNSPDENKILPGPEKASAVVSPGPDKPAPVNPHSNNNKKGSNNIIPLPPSGASPKGDRATRLPREFAMPAEWREWAADEAPKFRAMVDHEAAKFVDHWHGNGQRKIDWAATWRNWWRRAVERAPRQFGIIPSAKERANREAQDFLDLIRSTAPGAIQ